jgi:hypothetical protein
MRKDVLVSALVYLGLITSLVGLVMLIKPIHRLGVKTRPKAGLVLTTGLSVALMALLWPASQSAAGDVTSKLDEFIPAWQFSEHHRLEIGAPPERVFAAIRLVRGDEVALLRTLTWIRRGGRSGPESILNPGSEKPLLDVALSSGFTLLVDDPPREVVISTVPARGTFAAMNFMVRPVGPNRSILTTETRVFANTPSARRAFGIYWRLIYPGSALIRRTWLRAIRKRALR